MSQEETGYDLDSYFPPRVTPHEGNLPRKQNIIHGGWREKICQWSYNVVDHFDLPREIVSISLNYFDRYMATLSTSGGETKTETDESTLPGGSGDLALLASLGTLHLATKVHAINHNDYDPSLGPLEEQHHKVPSLSTLANLSRGQFGPSSILEMEKILLGALRWRLHPPTLYAFVTFLLKLLPTTSTLDEDDPSRGTASELFEVAMYVAELSVCDAFFVDRQIPPSTIALAAIATAMDELLAQGEAVAEANGGGRFTEAHRDAFFDTCYEHLCLGRHDNTRRGNHLFDESLERLRSMYLGASVVVQASEPHEAANPVSKDKGAAADDDEGRRQRTNSYNPPCSPSSIADMSLSTINSTIHSMAETTIGGGGSVKRVDSMVSSIACQSISLASHGRNPGSDRGPGHRGPGGGDEEDDDDDDELFFGGEGGDGSDSDRDDGAPGNDDDQLSRSGTSHHFLRYSPSPPRNNPGADDHDDRNLHRGAAPTSLMSCSPIVATR